MADPFFQSMAVLVRKDALVNKSGEGTLSLILLLCLGFTGLVLIIFSKNGETEDPRGAL